uniref:Viral A-type inclusion protein n=1 Tax=Strongyloides venezuelensis TaxID=75913 RepID=A0A0K0F4A0_STRVS
MLNISISEDDNILQEIHEKNRKIKQNDIHIQYLEATIKAQNAEIDSYRNSLASLSDKNGILEERNCTLEKLNEFKHLLMSELEAKIEECTRKENKIEELIAEVECLTAWNNIIMEELENYRSSMESKASLNETPIDIFYSSFCSESNVSAYDSHTKYDEVVEILTKKNNEIKDLMDEVECLRHEKTRMSSELNILRNELEEINNNFNCSLLLQPSLDRISLTNIMNLNEEYLKVPQKDISIAIEMPENIQFMDPTIRVEEENYKEKIEELEVRLFECNQKLHESIAIMESHQCQISCNDEIEEDKTQFSTEDSVNEEYLINLEKIKKAHEEEIKSLEDVIEHLKDELLSSTKQESDKMEDRKNIFITIFDCIFVVVKSFFYSIIRKLQYMK